MTNNGPALELIQKTVFDERIPGGHKRRIDSIKMPVYKESCKHCVPGGQAVDGDEAYFSE